MKASHYFILVSGIAATAVSSMPGTSMANDKEGRYEFTSCFAGTVRVLAVNDKLSARSVNISGISFTSPTGGPFHGQTFDCAISALAQDGHTQATGHCVHADGNGDRWISRFSDRDMIGTVEAVGGTGKYNGMVLTGQFSPAVIAAPITAGSVQICLQNSGTYRMR